MPVIGFLCAAGRLRPLPRWWRRFARALERQAMSRGGTSPLNLLGRRAYNPQSRLLRAYCFVSLPGLSTHTNGSLDPAVTCKTLSCSCAASFCASSTVVRPALRLSQHYPAAYSRLDGDRSWARFIIDNFEEAVRLFDLYNHVLRAPAQPSPRAQAPCSATPHTPIGGGGCAELMHSLHNHCSTSTLQGCAAFRQRLRQQ
jgi:hypothetical protein